MKNTEEKIKLLQESLTLVMNTVGDIQKYSEIIETNVNQNYQYIISLKGLQDVATKKLDVLQHDATDRINNLESRISQIEQSYMISMQDLEEKIKRLEDITKILLVEAKNKGSKQ